MPRLRKRLVVLLVVLACIGCDGISKGVAVDRLAGGPCSELLGGVVLLTYAENAGAFLGLGDALPPGMRWSILVLGVAGLLAAIAFYLWRSRELPWVPVVGLAMILGGGLGNLHDRLVYGFVRDFVQLRVGPLHTGIFNAADAAITVGVVMVALHSVLRPGEGRSNADELQ